MPTKEQQLVTLAGTVRQFADQETPTVNQWNVDPTILAQLATLVGQFFTQIEAALAAQLVLFDADHDINTGANPVPAEWIAEPAATTFIGPTQLQLPGDHRPDYAKGHRIRATIGASTVIVAVTNVAFAGNATTLTLESGVLTSGLTGIARALVRYSAPKVTLLDILAKSVLNAAIDDGAIDNRTIAATTIDGLAKIVAASCRQSLFPANHFSQSALAARAASPIQATNSAGGGTMAANQQTDWVTTVFAPTLAGRLHLVIAQAEVRFPSNCVASFTLRRSGPSPIANIRTVQLGFPNVTINAGGLQKKQESVLVIGFATAADVSNHSYVFTVLNGATAGLEVWIPPVQVLEMA